MAGCRGGDPRPERATKKKQGCCALVLTLLFVELCATGERSGIRGSQGGAETAERGGAVARSALADGADEERRQDASPRRTDEVRSSSRSLSKSSVNDEQSVLFCAGVVRYPAKKNRGECTSKLSINVV